MVSIGFEHMVWLYNEAKVTVDEYRGAIRCLNWRDVPWNKPQMKRRMLMFKTMELILADEIESKYGRIL